MKTEQQVDIKFLVRLKKIARWVKCMKKTAELLKLQQGLLRGMKGPYRGLCGKYFERDNM